MLPGNFSKVDLKIDKPFLTTSEKILDGFGLFNELLELRNSIFYLVLIKLDKVDSFFPFGNVLLGDFQSILVVRQPPFKGCLLDILFFLHFRLLLYFRLWLNVLYFFAHDC